MHENKFEKQVSEKMDQLGFDPSDAVWLRVDKEINEEKKRRKPIFWIFFLSGLLVAGGVSYILMNNFTTAKKIPDLPAQIAKGNQDDLQKDHQVQSTRLPENVRTGKNSGSFQTGNNSWVKAGSVVLSGKSKRETEKDEFVEKTVEQKSQNIVLVPVQPRVETENSKSGENPKAAPVDGEKTNKTATADSVSEMKTVKDKKQKTNKPIWSIGFTAGAGASNINQSLFQPQNSTSLSSSLYYPVPNGPGTPATLNSPSGTNAGFSFNLGFFVKRNLSKRVSGSAGLGYHYYSTGIHTGIPVDSFYTVNFSNALTASVNSYYRNGDGKEFTNQYHFIELPLNMSFQLNKSRKNPVNWEAGLSLAWLVSTNALHFDPYNNVYFENSQLFNKIQWNATTSFMVGFPIHNNTIQIGPQVQYGLTSLLKNNGSYPGHLTYFGLKCSFNP